MTALTPEARHADIGRRIRETRLNRKMRQVDLAAKAGISWRHLIRMERGEGGEPKPETLNRLAEALGVARSELASDDDEESDLPADLLHAAAAFARALSRSRSS